MKALDLLKRKVEIAKKSKHNEVRFGLKDLERLLLEISIMENAYIERERDNIILQSVVKNANIPRKKRKTSVSLEGDKF